MTKFCTNCGQELENNMNNCPNCGHKINSNANSNTEQKNNSIEQKSRIVAGVLGILLGYLGVHNFYLGYTNKGLAQLLITVLSCGYLYFISGIWGLIEGIMLLIGNINLDRNGNPLGQ